MNYSKVIFSVFIFVVLLSCKESELQPNEPTLPPLTTTGEGTFGCRIDGEIWVAKVDPSIWINDVSASYFPNDSNRFGIGALLEYEDESLEKVTFDTYLTHGTGNYQMLADPELEGYEGYYFIGRPDCEYYHDFTNPGTINIVHWDENKNILSGYFEMVLINPDCSEDTLMHITEGRFDINYVSWP